MPIFHCVARRLTLSCGSAAITYSLYPSYSQHGFPVRYLQHGNNGFPRGSFLNDKVRATEFSGIQRHIQQDPGTDPDTDPGAISWGTKWEPATFNIVYTFHVNERANLGTGFAVHTETILGRLSTTLWAMPRRSIQTVEREITGLHIFVTEPRKHNSQICEVTQILQTLNARQFSNEIHCQIQFLQRLASCNKGASERTTPSTKTNTSIAMVFLSTIHLPRLSLTF